jgi:hypothetical protein
MLSSRCMWRLTKQELWDLYTLGLGKTSHVGS